MKYPTLEPINSYPDVTDVFGGYNHNLKITENEFYDMKNLTSDGYPLLMPRKQRGVYPFPLGSSNHSVNGLICKDALCYVDGTELLLNNTSILNGLTDTPKQLVSMGAYVIIFPDGVYINTKDYTDWGHIDSIYTQVGGTVVSLCKLDGTVESYSTSNDPPANPQNMALWLDTSSDPHTLKQYSSLNSTWVSVATTYVKIEVTNIGEYFSEGDGITISGLSSLGLDGSTIIQKIYHDEDYPTNDYIVVVGLVDAVTTVSGEITFSRVFPLMDFVVESGNRLWGCRYGQNGNGEVVNEIYASKLGDFKNWNCFQGISTDSYVASVGTDGAFTGAFTYLGYPTFFKENYLHKVYGQYPANFQVQSTECRGVQKGAGESLAVANEVLFYKSRNGVCMYDGSLPVEISYPFGGENYSAVDTDDNRPLWNGASAGAINGKYYISMKSTSDGEWNLFVYDAEKKLWHREDNTHAKHFCACDGELYYVENNVIRTVNGTGTRDTLPIEWVAESGIIYSQSQGVRKEYSQRYLKRLIIRMMVEIGSRVIISIQYDSTGEWERVYSIVGTNMRSFGVPLKPKRCDHFRLRLEGKGNARVFSIVKMMEEGSDKV